ncbi:MAG TPA: rRNA methyltransferase [Erysipelotrichaceae bacterium]|nr:rRNA methyltransferase [Erysipelotrichaceae bacterium]
MQQFFVDEPLILNQTIPLDAEQVHQCINVLRYQSGQEVICVDKKQMRALCRLEIQVAHVLATPIEMLKQNSEMEIKITLIQALIRKERWEFLLQKATELGVHRVVPLVLRRNVVKWDKTESQHKRIRYQKIMQEASEQSKRTYVPQLMDVITLQEIQSYRSDNNLVCYENEHARFIKEVLNPHESITLVCGPEGGFDPSEIEQLESMGFKTVHLGARILRAETAGLYVLSAVDFMFEEHQR